MREQAKIKSDIFKLGLYQIIGGGIGVLLILFGLFSGADYSGLNSLVFLIMFVFFTFSVLCGYLCVKNNQKALQYSFINQVMQILGFAFFGFAFTYVAGLYIYTGIDLSKSADITFGTGISKFEITINKEPDRAEITINLFALVVIYFIENIKKKTKQLNKLPDIVQ